MYVCMNECMYVCMSVFCLKIQQVQDLLEKADVWAAIRLCISSSGE